MATLTELMDLNMLNECTWECTRQSRWKETTQRYIANMLPNNINLKEEVLEHRYAVKPTIDFNLNERGHLRKIEAPVIRDRIVQKSLMKNILIPSLRPCLIYDNYASLKQRGTTSARKRFEIMLRRFYRENRTDGYILLIDIRKYFENIDHDVLKELIAPRIKDEPAEVVDLIHYIIDTSSKTGKGLNLGSEAPQIFAVYYLNRLDTFVKVVKGVRYYGRYMDDIFILGNTKEELKRLLSEIEGELSNLKLEINPTKTQIVRLTHGFTFLQIKYSLADSGRIIKRPSRGKVVRERRRLKAFKRQYDAGVMTEEEIYNCYQSWRGTFIKDHNAYRNTLRSLDSLYGSLFPKHEDKEKAKRSDIVNELYRESDPKDINYCLIFN